MENFTAEFYIALQFIINAILLIVLFFTIKKIRVNFEDYALDFLKSKASENIISIFQPIVKDANETSNVFANQIKEKKRIINMLNKKLDDKIININLILKRAKQYLNKTENKKSKIIEPDFVYNQQEEIFNLFKKGKKSKAIAKKLSIAQGEVDLIIGLKKKLIAMGK